MSKGKQRYVNWNKQKQMWQARYRGKSRFAHTEREAYAKLDELKAQFHAGIIDCNSKVKKFLETYLAWVEQNRATATYDSYKLAIDNHISPRLGHFKVVDLNASHIDSWLLGLECGDRTKQNAFAVLKAALNRAVKQRLLLSNPCNLIDRPRVKEKQKAIFTIEEMGRIIEESKNYRIGGVVELAFRIGARQNEIFGLQWKNVDFNDNLIWLIRSVTESCGKLEEKSELKTKSSRRAIQVDDACMEVFHRRRELAFKEGNAQPDDYVFCSSNGKAQRRGSFRTNVWNKILEKLGIEHRGLHRARDTFVSLSLSGGANVRAVSQIVGHSKTSTTTDKYAAFIKGDDVGIITNFGKKIGGVG